MSITPDGWLDWAKRDHGPADKKYSQPCTSQIYVPHSAVGYYPGWVSRLKSTARNADGSYTDYAAASVTGWIAYDGTVTQHYPFTVSCWASGSSHLNINGNAFENEGGHTPVNEPLTEAQIAANVRILKDMAAWKGRNPATYWRRPTSTSDKTATLYEHRETPRFGGAATACPSNRIPWAEILRRLQGPAPEPPATITEIGGYAAIVWEPEIPRAYLFTGSRLEWLPSDEVYNDLVRALNVSPVTVDEPTFAWMVEQHVRAGGSWPGR